MAELTNRKSFTTTLSNDNVEKLKTLSEKKGVPKTKILDDAVNTLYEKEESMEQEAKMELPRPVRLVRVQDESSASSVASSV